MHEMPIPKYKRAARVALSLMKDNPRDPRHGTVKGYNYGCRCDRCREAKHWNYATREKVKRHEKREREKWRRTQGLTSASTAGGSGTCS